ncbi:unnamed protein product [Allacma fusca]|uniref:Diuretic hormone receptor n=1 Tax=Allacma fusca TaxID=39272 RepID=A0A8J2K1C8_9HEXA|nr:unnamed protein product [Allacma fusca]
MNGAVAIISDEIPLSSSADTAISQHPDLDTNSTNFESLDTQELQCHFANQAEDGSLSTFLDPDASATSSSVLTAIKRIFQTDNDQTMSLSHLDSISDGTILHCNRTWDKLICWPEIPQGHSVTVPCFAFLNNIPYDTSRTVTRACKEGGIWEEKTNYSNCVALSTPPENPNEESNLEITTWVYFFGYCLSLTALILAVSIFVSFKELRCLRNKIHCHLILTYIFAGALWLITSIQSHVVSHSQGSCITFILLHYFHLTNFFWMFVEGLYLYVLVVKTFTAENIKLRTYAFIGWGIPLIVVVGWSIAKWMTQAQGVSSQQQEHHETVSTKVQKMEEPGAPSECVWLTVNMYDWIYKSPAIFVLAANILFLLKIMWVLITKLRSATNPETQQSRKAAKALVVLMPLLGVTYLLVLTGSKQIPLYEHIRALLISTQGFLVALLYCFLNGEVRKAVRRGWNRCGGPSLACCDCQRGGHLNNMREWSLPRSRTESIRLYHPTTTAQCQNNRHSHFSRGRIESTVSEMTTLTNMTHSNSIQFGNMRSASGSGSASVIARPTSIMGDSVCGRNGFDQILLSPTLTSISTNLSALTTPSEQCNRTDQLIHFGSSSATELADVDYIDNFEGQQYGM